MEMLCSLWGGGRVVMIHAPLAPQLWGELSATSPELGAGGRERFIQSVKYSI